MSDRKDRIEALEAWLDEAEHALSMARSHLKLLGSDLLPPPPEVLE